MTLGGAVPEQLSFGGGQILDSLTGALALPG